MEYWISLLVLLLVNESKRHTHLTDIDLFRLLLLFLLVQARVHFEAEWIPITRQRKIIGGHDGRGRPQLLLPMLQLWKSLQEAGNTGKVIGRLENYLVRMRINRLAY